jgi:hypothetical protein
MERTRKPDLDRSSVERQLIKISQELSFGGNQAVLAEFLIYYPVKVLENGQCSIPRTNCATEESSIKSLERKVNNVPGREGD